MFSDVSLPPDRGRGTRLRRKLPQPRDTVFLDREHAPPAGCEHHVLVPVVRADRERSEDGTRHGVDDTAPLRGELERVPAVVAEHDGLVSLVRTATTMCRHSLVQPSGRAVGTYVDRTFATLDEGRPAHRHAFDPSDLLRSNERDSQCVLRLRRLPYVVRVERELEHATAVRAGRSERHRGQLARTRHLRVLNRTTALHEGEDRKPYRDDERDDHSPEHGPLSPLRRLAARKHELVLERRRRRILRLRLGQHLLRRTQIAAVEQEARVPAAPVPFLRAHEQPRVRVHPIGIDFERRNELLNRFVRPRREIEPLRLAQRRRDRLVRNRPIHDRPDPLAGGDRDVEFASTMQGVDCSRAQHEHERPGPSYRLLERRLVVRRPVGDVLPVDVDVLVAAPQCGVQPLHELPVAARV